MKKNIIIIISALISYIGVLISSKLIYNSMSFNIILTALFFLILYFYYKYNISLNKRERIFSLMLSMVISFLLSIGSIVSLYSDNDVMPIFNIKNIIYCIISIVGLTILLYKIFGYMFKKINTISLLEEHNKMNKKTFVLITLSIFIIYFLYFIRFYPAIMTPDSYYVIHYSNNFILSDFHPFGHTWFFGIFFHLGKLLFNNLNKAVAFATLVQMGIMSLIFSNVIKFLYNKGVKKWICIMIFIAYAFSPLHAYYSITVWRDILFGGSFAILMISLYELISNEKEINKKYIILFILGSLILLFFRNNGIYIYLFMIPFIIIFFKKKRLLYSIITITTIVFYFVIKGPVFNYFNVEKTTSVEAFSIPLQQMARVISSSKEISGEDRKYLEKLFEYDKVSENYKTYISDPVKNLTNNEILSNDKKEFIKTYSSLFFKYPNIYFDAYFLQTLGYWYPDIIYNCTGGESSSIFSTENISSYPLTPSFYNKIIDFTVSRKIPLSNLIWSVGLQFIILLISTFIMCYLKKYKYIICFIPLYGLWLSIMVATPVFCELRYIYGLFVCTPLTIFIPFLLNNKSLKRRSI